MLNRLPSTICCVCLLLAALPLAGCRESGTAGELVIVRPETIEVDGTAWEKQAWNKQMDQKLAGLFRRSPMLIDNPSISGDPVCYANGSTQRVYWLSQLDHSCHWAMVEFKGGRGGSLIEGNGAPFMQTAVADN